MEKSLIIKKNFLQLTLVIVVLSVQLFSCKKEIGEQPNSHEEITASANQDHGHLQQSKTFSSEVVTKWIEVQSRVFPNAQEQPPGLVFFPPRFYGYCGIALYESVVPGMPFYQSLSEQLIDMQVMPKTQPGMAYHWSTCANTALAYMTKHLLTHISSGKKASIDSLEAALNSAFQTEVPEATFNRSIQFGKNIAETIFNWSITDGFFDTYPPYIPPTGIGLWVPTPPAFMQPGPVVNFRDLRLFMPGLLTNSSLPEPIAYSTDPSSVFFNSMKEVYDISQGISASLVTQANYWRGLQNGGPGAQWYNILRKIIMEQGNGVMLDKATVAYCKAGLAFHDAAITNFIEAFRYNTIRPITFIRNVMGYSSWNTIFPTVPYPSYPDFHATIAGASGEVFSSLFGNNYHFNTAGTDALGLPGYTYNSFEEAGTDAALSRFYAGVNSKPFVYAGSWQGKKTAEYMESKIRFLK
ncbi:MAG TPA: hypothetical protein VJ765_13325 [Chitinophagaceae bacterium]|nr:hypothetical protein [Chitinophagaceae bacterium]